MKNVKKMTFVNFDFSIEGLFAKIAHYELDSLFEGKQNCNVYVSETLAQKCAGNTCKFWHLQSNGVTENIELCDLDLEGQQFKMIYIYISETVTASAKNLWETFVDFAIFH